MNICIHNDNFNMMHVCPALLLSILTLQIVIPFYTGNQPCRAYFSQLFPFCNTGGSATDSHCSLFVPETWLLL